MSSSGGAMGLLMLILIYLTFVSGMIAWTIEQKEGTEINTFNIPDNSPITVYSQDYTSNKTYDNNLLGMNEDIWQYQEGIGIVRIDTSSAWQNSPLVWGKITATNDIYTNTYEINNSVHGEFTIWLRYTGSYLSTSDNIYVKFLSDGIHVPSQSFGIETGDLYYYPVSGLLSKNDLSVKTVYNSNDNYAEIYIDGVKQFTVYDLPELTILSIEDLYYAAIVSNTIGFTVQKLNSVFSYTQTSYGIMDTALGYIGTFGQVLLWFVDEQYLPWIWNIIGIKIPLLIAALIFVMVIL